MWSNQEINDWLLAFRTARPGRVVAFNAANDLLEAIVEGVRTAPKANLPIGEGFYIDWIKLNPVFEKYYPGVTYDPEMYLALQSRVQEHLIEAVVGQHGDFPGCILWEFAHTFEHLPEAWERIKGRRPANKA